MRLAIARNALPLLALATAAAFCPDGATRAQQAPAAAPPPSIEYGVLTITGYELREVRLARPWSQTLSDGTVRRLDWAWQVVVHGPRFPVRALDPRLLVGETSIWAERREVHADSEALVFQFADPALLRAERDLTVIYGDDERTRTRLLERLDPEKLVRLPAAERAALSIPELEGVTIDGLTRSGSVSGGGRIAAGRIALAARLQDGRLKALAKEIALDADGRFAVEVGPLPAAATHIVALLATGGGAEAAPVDGLELSKLPTAIEVLDSKPIDGKSSAGDPRRR